MDRFTEHIPTFKHPDIVKIATILAVSVILLTVHHAEYLNTFSFKLSMGLGILYLTAAGWALMGNAGNTAVYIIFLGVLMMLFGFSFTPADSIAALAVDAIEPQIIGAVGGLFTIALKHSMDKAE